MASGLTTQLLLPYPLSTDPVNVHGDVEALAQRLENLLNLFAREDATNSFIFPNTFVVDSPLDAIRITQTGSGNALLVEDSTNPDSTPFVINSLGDVGIGKISPDAKLDVLGSAIITVDDKDDVPLQIIGAISQEANVFEIKNSSGAVKLSIDQDGNVTGGTYNGTIIPTDDVLVTEGGQQTLINKIIDLDDNTVVGTLANFNEALSDGDFATLDGEETLTNKTLTSPTISDPVFTGQATGLELGFGEKIVFEGETADDFELTLSAGDPTEDRTVTLPDATTTLVGQDTTDTLTNKSIDLQTNTITGTVAEFNAALSDDDFATLSGTETLTNKTIDLAENFITGTTSNFNAALTDDDFATLDGEEDLRNKTLISPILSDAVFSGQATGLELAVGQNLVFEGTTEDDFELTLSAGDPTADVTVTLPDANTTLVGQDTEDTLTNKTIDLSENTVTGTVAEFNEALSDADFATTAGEETLTNKTIDLSENTIIGTVAEFNEALTDDDFVTLTGEETLTNKTLTSPTISDPVFTGQASGLELAVGQNLVFEGATEDDFELTLSAGDPTEDRTVVLPNADTILVGQDTQDTLTNKTIDLSENTLSGTVEEFNAALSDDDFATLTGEETLTNKTLTSPTISDPVFTGQASGLELAVGQNLVFEGETADDFELTLSAGDPTEDRTVVLPDANTTLVGQDTEDTLTNKTIDLSENTVTGTVAEFNEALSDGDFASLEGAETLKNKTIDLVENTVTGTIEEFNSALSDGDFATLDGEETLSNKTLGTDLDADSLKIINLSDPTDPQDAATKGYVDSVAQGLDIKESVKVATTGPIDLADAPDVIDGITIFDGARVLIKDQTLPRENGIYVYNDGVMTRSPDADATGKLTAGSFTFVEEGNTYADTGWVVISDDPFLVTSGEGFFVGMTAIIWAQFSGAGTFLAGDGLDLDGNTFAAVGTEDRIEVSSTGIDISSSYVGQESITTLGTVDTGVWEASIIDIEYGGTGADTATDAINNLLPNQDSNAGKYLSTDGTGVAWTTIDALPSQSGNDGKFLVTSGEDASWSNSLFAGPADPALILGASEGSAANILEILNDSAQLVSSINSLGQFVGDGSLLTGIDGLPDQTDNAGKFLTTDGTTATWEVVDLLPNQSGNAGKFLTTDGEILSWVDVSSGGGGNGFTLSETAPSNPSEGDGWYDTTTGKAYLWYVDIDSSQWVEIGSIFGEGGGTSGAGVTASETPPEAPQAGELWWNSLTGVLYIYYDDFWVEAVTGIVGPQGPPGPEGPAGPAGADAASTITGAASTIATADLTANRAVIANGSGKVAVSSVTSTELGHVSGVTSGIQGQINGKANIGHSHNTDQIIQPTTAVGSGTQSIDDNFRNKFVNVDNGGSAATLDLLTNQFSQGEYVTFFQFGTGTVTLRVNGGTSELYSFGGEDKIQGQYGMVTATRFGSGFAVAGRLRA